MRWILQRIMLLEIQQITINRLKFFILSSRHVTVLDWCFKLYTFLKIIPELFKLHIFHPTFVTTPNISLSYHIIGLKSNTEIIITLLLLYNYLYTRQFIFVFFFLSHIYKVSWDVKMCKMLSVRALFFFL